MCEVGGKLQIVYEDDRGYLKMRIGHKGAYIPPSGSERLRQWVRQNEGKVINAETMRGMLTKITSVVPIEREHYGKN